MYPQIEQVFDEGSKRLINTNVLPLAEDIYLSFRMKLEKLRSLIFFPHRHCMALIFNVSKHITSYLSVSSLASFQWKSSRWLVVLRYARLRLSMALRLFFEPLTLLDTFWCALRITFWFCMKNNGDSISSPLDAVRKVFRPKSNPTISPVLGVSLDSMVSVMKKRYMSPRESRLTVRSLIFPSISRDLKYLYTVLPMRTLLPSRSLYPDCFNVNDLYFSRFLNPGGEVLMFFLRFRKNSLYALSMRSVMF